MLGEDFEEKKRFKEDLGFDWSSIWRYGERGFRVEALKVKEKEKFCFVIKKEKKLVLL